MCIKCKYTMCNECFREHNKANLLQTIQIHSNREEIESIFKNVIQCQYFCYIHLLKYKYYCPVCKINLCKLCRDEHIHINYKKLLVEKIKLDDINEISNDCFKKLYHLVKILNLCYENSFTNSKMTLNILLNNILAKNIIAFIQRNQIPSKGIEIKNDYLDNININSCICKEYDNEEFNKYYSNLISNASVGNIRQYYKLNEIRKYYKSDNFPNLFRIINFNDILSLKVENAISSFFLVETKLNINYLNFTLFKCVKKIDELKLKLELNEYSLQLLKIFYLKMNYILDFEIRKKVGNILGQIICDKFYTNLHYIKQTKYLYTFSNERIKKIHLML